MIKPPDNPQVHISANEARPGLVLLSVGTGTIGYSITPEMAVQLATDLLNAAAGAHVDAANHAAATGGASE